MIATVFVDPPHNLTVQPMELHGQLNVSWLPFENPYLKTNIHYEVNIFSKAQSQRVSHCLFVTEPCQLPAFRGTLGAP